MNYILPTQFQFIGSEENSFQNGVSKMAFLTAFNFVILALNPLKVKRLALLMTTLAFLACDKGDSLPTEEVEKNFTISSTDSLKFLLSEGIPREGGFCITEQAEHFVMSEIQYRENGLFYVYLPEKDFTGEDLVKIKREDSNGSKIYAQQVTTLKIQVTE